MSKVTTSKACLVKKSGRSFLDVIFVGAVCARGYIISGLSPLAKMQIETAHLTDGDGFCCRRKYVRNFKI